MVKRSARHDPISLFGEYTTAAILRRGESAGALLARGRGVLARIGYRRPAQTDLPQPIYAGFVWPIADRPRPSRPKSAAARRAARSFGEDMGVLGLGLYTTYGQWRLARGSTRLAGNALRAYKARRLPPRAVRDLVVENYERRIEKSYFDRKRLARTLQQAEREVTRGEAVRLARAVTGAKVRSKSAALGEIDALGKQLAHVKRRILGSTGRAAGSLIGYTAIVGAMATAYSLARVSALEAGKSSAQAGREGVAAGAVAGGAVAGASWGLSKALKGASVAAGAVAPVLGRVVSRAAPAVAIGAAVYEAYRGYKKAGATGAAVGLADFATFGAYSYFFGKSKSKSKPVGSAARAPAYRPVSSGDGRAYLNAAAASKAGHAGPARAASAEPPRSAGKREEAKSRDPTKGRVFVEGFTRADGTRVRGYWRKIK